jgi:hypothetical protein
MVQDDLLVQRFDFHNTAFNKLPGAGCSHRIYAAPKNFWVWRTPSASASTSSWVLYT